MSLETISVIGLGYIGLPTAAIIASRKIRVIGIDVNERAVDMINQGQIHIVEPDLDLVVHDVVKEGYLRASTVVEPANAFIIAVPTPFIENSETGDLEPDLSYIEKASQAIAPALSKGNLIILESTSPVGATEQMASWLADLRPDLSFPQNSGEEADIQVAHCPERVLPGQVMHELVHNDRVIGGMTEKCAEKAVALYKTFVTGSCLTTSVRTAEMAKLTENSFRDVNIAFANELSIICEKLDIDVWELIALSNRHPRVDILKPGPGVGGHCIAVDPWFVVSSSPKEARLIRTARNVNDDKPKWAIKQIVNAVSDFVAENPHKKPNDVTVACYGLAFKPDIDDLRESPALYIVNCLSNELGCEIQVVEPNIETLPKMPQNVRLVQNPDADVHVFLVKHKEFKDVKLPLKAKVLDFCGLSN